MGALKQNIKFAIRTLVNNKGFSLTAVLTLALGIGATTAIFSFVYAVFEPMPYPKPDQLVMVWSWTRNARGSVPAGDFFEWQRRSSSFQGMGAWAGASFNIAADDRPTQVPGSRRSPGFFTFEGISLMLGRDFLPEESQPGKDHVVILSNRLWTIHFGANRDLIGKDIRMNGEAYTVVGVLPPGMHDRFNSQVWVPLSLRPEQITHDSNSLLVMGRLKNGVSIGQAQAEMDRIGFQLQSEFPQTNANRTISVQPLHLNFVTDSTRRNLWLLLGAVGFLLLIGCVNVANLLFARGITRQRELALRAALGASRARLFAQVLTESLVVAILGGALGILFAGAIVAAITAVMPPVGTMLPSEANIRISIPVLLFTIGLTSLSGVLSGAVPAWQATRLDLNEVLKLAGRSVSGGSRRKVLRTLVVLEFSLALTLLATAGLALRSFWNLTHINLGIEGKNVLTFRLPVPEKRLRGQDQARTYYGTMLERIEALPGITKAAVMTGVPARWTTLGTRFSLVSQPPPDPGERRSASFLMVTPDYFEALGIGISRGRGFDEHDSPNSMRVATVNEFFVTRYLNGIEPIGQRISVDEFLPGEPRGKPVVWQIVGVYPNVRGTGFREDVPQITVPFAQSPWPQASIVVKTAGDPKNTINGLAAAVHSVDPDLPLAGVQTVDEIVSETLAIDRFSVVLFSSFGALGLLLSAVGIYGVMAFAVAQRRHEFGVRLALGAPRSRVINLVVKEGLVLALGGSALGLSGAYLVGRAMQSTLYGVGVLDFRALAGVSFLLLLAALLACLLPAWRASRVEPMEALRLE